MRHLRMVGLSLVAVFAIAAITASSASALPEWGKCDAKAGGKYSDGNCTVKAKKGTGTFEWTKGKNLANVPFSGKSVGGGGVLTSTDLECRGGSSSERRVSRGKCEEDGGEAVDIEDFLFVECAQETNSGEAEGTNKIANVHVTFKGCAALGAIPCNGAGLEEGEIKTSTLKGSLGYISKAGKEVGVVLEPATKHGHFADFDCAGLGLSTTVGVGNKKEGAYYTPESHGGYDQIISPITPVNTMTSEFTQVYTQEHDANVPAKLEKSKHLQVLEDYLYVTENPEESLMWSKAGEEITNVNTPEKPGEIKA